MVNLTVDSLLVSVDIHSGKDSFLRMNSIASALYSPYAIWFPLYIAVAYAGLPFLFVARFAYFLRRVFAVRLSLTGALFGCYKHL